MVKDKHELQMALRRMEANLEEERLKATCAEQRNQLKVVEVEQQVTATRSECAHEAAQLIKIKESQQSYRSNTETQLVSLRRELSQAQVELSTRSIRDDRTEVESQREQILEETRFVTALENELDSFEVCVQIEAEQYLKEKILQRRSQSEQAPPE